MALKLRALSGPLEGQEFKLKAGLRIGRSKGDIILDDGKVSSLHAFVEIEGGDLVLVDNGSKNGIRINGERVQRVRLLPNATFQIGTSDFRVLGRSESKKVVIEDDADFATPAPAVMTERIAEPAAKIQSRDDVYDEVTNPAAQLAQPAAEADKPTTNNALEAVEGPAAAKASAEPAGRRWNDVLAEFADQVTNEIADRPRALVAFDPPIRLTFIGGLQAETVWELGYGPRRAGAASVDLPLFEPGAPDISFEILPAPEGVTFRTNHPKEVKINGGEARVKLLSQGDMIAIGSTRIEIELLK